MVFAATCRLSDLNLYPPVFLAASTAESYQIGQTANRTQMPRLRVVPPLAVRLEHLARSVVKAESLLQRHKSRLMSMQLLSPHYSEFAEQIPGMERTLELLRWQTALLQWSRQDGDFDAASCNFHAWASVPTNVLGMICAEFNRAVDAGEPLLASTFSEAIKRAVTNSGTMQHVADEAR